jgi:transcriptional regulator with XRE-family HTH domain
MDLKPVPGWGARLRVKRKELGLTLEQVAKAVGATKSAVSQWEREEIKDIAAGYVQGFSELYKKPAAWIIGHDLKTQDEDDDMFEEKRPIKPVVVTDIPPARLDLIRMYGRLPQELRGTVRMLIESLAAMHSERYAKFETEQAERPKPPKS